MFAAFSVYLHSCSPMRLVFHKDVEVMVSERYKRAIFRPPLLLVTTSISKDTIIFLLSSLSLLSTYSCFSNSPMLAEVYQPKVDRRRLIEVWCGHASPNPAMRPRINLHSTQNLSSVFRVQFRSFSIQSFPLTHRYMSRSTLPRD